MLFLLFFFCGLAPSNANAPVVSTAQGKLQGSILKTVTGRDIFSFRGVRFAEPPVGELRFRPPVPPASWTGIRNATEDGSPCPQYSTTYGNTSEDCLFLNVYTTKLPLPRKGDNPLRPVLVFFHPGGFYSMSGGSTVFGPLYLLDQDIVLVTTNYRLGALGFLSAEDSVLPGNYGLKDQVQALRWINQNIAAFGGNSDSVTISGYSAGSISVLLHMMSPMSRRLFHRCVAMSASPVNQLPPGRLLNQALSQARLVNCPTENTQQMVDCMRQRPVEQIIVNFRSEWGWDPILEFAPAIERDFGDDAERFLTADPTVLLMQGNFTKVPLIAGITKDEFAWKALQVLSNSSWADDMSENFERIAPISFMYERDTERSRYISRELRRFYLGDEPITNASRVGLGHLYEDSIIDFAMDRAVKLIASVSRAPVYNYMFTFPGQYSFIYYPWDSKIPYGVSHHDDLIYLFSIPVFFPTLTRGQPEYETMRKMTKMWANFVKSGNPTPEQDPLLNNVEWKRFTPQNLEYMDIGSTFVMKKDGFYQDRMAVWNRLFPLPSIKN